MTREVPSSSIVQPDSVILQVGLHPDVDKSKLQMRLPKEMFIRIRNTVGDIFREHRGVIFVAATFAVAASASAYVVYEAIKKQQKKWETNDPFENLTPEELQLFGEVYQTHHPMLVRFLAPFGFDRPTAYDITQETFLRVAPYFSDIIPTGDPKYPYGVYLRVVAKFLALNRARDVNRRGRIEKYIEVKDERDDGMAINTPYRDDIDPEIIFLEEEDEREQTKQEAKTRDQLLKIMNKLTDEQKALIWLKFLLERPDKEIASIFQLDVNIIKSRIHRLRKILKRLGK